MFARTAAAAAALAVCLAAAGCGNKAAAPPSPKIALVAGPAGFGDRSYNDGALAGLTVCRRETGIDVSTFAPAPGADEEQRLALAATEQFNAVVAIGFPAAGALANVARRFEGTHFAVLDAVVDLPNVESITFAEQQGAFLAGALAGLVTATENVAFIGGTDAPLVEKSAAGFAAGVREVNPRARVAVHFAHSFADAAPIRQMAGALFEDGIDIAYVVAGPAGAGAFDAVKTRPHRYLIGTDSDQDGLAPGHVLASVVKRVDVAALAVCRETVGQKPVSGHVVLGVAEDGIGLSNFTYTRAIVGTANVARLGRIRAAIAAGKLVPPATAAELARFRPGTY